MFWALVLCANPAEIRQKLNIFLLMQYFIAEWYFRPTLKRIYSDLLAKCERLVDIFLLDTLDPQVWEGGGHVVVHVDSADSFLASLLANKIVRMRFVRSIVRDTRYDNNSLARVTNHLYSWEGFIVRTAVDSRNTSSWSSFTFISKPQTLGCWLLEYLDEGTLLCLGHLHLWFQIIVLTRVQNIS